MLAYAAALYGMETEELEQACGTHDIASVVAKTRRVALTPRFSARLASYLQSGEFRVVVLDDAPADLIRIARYLSDVSDRLLVDVLTVHQFVLGPGEGSEVLLVPERVDLDRAPSLFRRRRCAR